MALTAKIKALITGQLTGSPDLGSAIWNFDSEGTKSISLADGTGLNQATKVHVDHGTTTTSYDLDAGTLLSPLGVAIAAFSRIVAVFVYCPPTNAANVTVGGDFILTKYLAGWVDDSILIPVHPGGLFGWVAPSATGVAVTASTGDVITVTPSGTDVYDIVIIGS